jgi:hypothetical protein
MPHASPVYASSEREFQATVIEIATLLGGAATS